MKTTSFISVFLLTVGSSVLTTHGQLLVTEVFSNQDSDGTEDFFELTNFGESPFDLTGYSFDDDSAEAGVAPVPGETILAPGESVLFTEMEASAFRSWWSLDETVQVITIDMPGLGGDDAINLFDPADQLALTFSYAAGGFTKINGDPSTGDHAGLSAGGTVPFQSAVIDLSFGTDNPRYTFADGITLGTFSSTLSENEFASPGILEGDPLPAQRLSIEDSSASENSGLIVLDVTRSDVATAFSVDFTVTAGSASDEDFESTSGTLSFAENGEATQPISVNILDDDQVESDETFTVTLSNLSNTVGDTVISDGEGLGTIVNDDTLSVAFGPSNILSSELLSSTDLGGSEIPAFDPVSQRAFASSSEGVQVIDLSDPSNPGTPTVIDLTGLGLPSNDVSSLAISDGVLALCTIASPKTDPGTVAFLDAATGDLLASTPVGANPDHVGFTPDGTMLLVANEGELLGDPADDVTPGSVSLIDISAGLDNLTVQTAGFAAFNDDAAALKEAGVRIYEGSSPEFDFEPEYIAIAAGGQSAMVTLQEANALARLDIPNATITDIIPLGLKDFSDLRADFSDQDGADESELINPITGQPVFGVYMPDAIASYQVEGATYYITANEGDDRDDFLPEEETARLADLDLDDATFPNETELLADETLGRLGVLITPGVNGDLDGDGDIDRIEALGARSYSIHDATGNRVYDSGDQLELINASIFPELLDDGRSDNKGPEPEGVTTGQIGDRTFAFIALERSNLVLVFDVTDPLQPSYVTGISNPDDESPEGMQFVTASDSPTGNPLLLVANEGSNTLAVHELSTPEEFTLELFHLADQEANAAATEDAPRLSAVLNALRDEDLGDDGQPDNTLTLSSGDAIIPGLFYEASEAVYGSAGIADIQIQNELGIQAIAFGNHEFDFGTASIAGLISGEATGTILDSDFTGANFPYLSGNLNFALDANMAPLATDDHQSPQANKVAATTVIDVNGENVGVVSAVTPTLASISSPGDLGISPSPFAGNPTPEQLDALAAVIQDDVNALLASDGSITKVILLAHMQQISIEQELATRLRNVDIIIAGGSNTRLFDSNDRIREGDNSQGTYPIFSSDADGQPIAVVNTDGSYKYLGRLVIDFDTTGNLVAESYDANVSGAYATDEQGVSDLDAAAFTDPEVQRIADEIADQIIATDGNFFGVTSEFLNGNRSGGPLDGVRTQETNLGNLTADANLAAAREVDSTVVFSIKNGGGIRASIGEIVVEPGQTTASRLAPQANPLSGRPAGGISQNAIQGALAFNNGLILLTLTKAEIVDLLEHGVSALPGVSGQFAQVGGVRFSYDESAASGSRLQSAALVDEMGNVTEILATNGEVVGDPDATFRTVTLDFLSQARFDEEGNFIGAGDGYPFPNFNTDPGTTEAPRTVAPAEQVARINPVVITTDSATGEATFANDYSEQDALAEYLAANFPMETPFAQADSPRESDLRIQALGSRMDLVLQALSYQVFADSFEANSENPETLFAFAYGLTPGATGELVIDENGNVLSRGTEAFSVEVSDDQVAPTLTFLRRKNANEVGLTYTLEYSTDLEDWFTSDSPVEVIGSEGEMEVVAAALPIFTPDFGKARFFRITVDNN